MLNGVNRQNANSTSKTTKRFTLSQKEDPVELPDFVVSIALLLTPVAIALAVGYLRDFYGLYLRVYERNLGDAYFQNFQARSTVARTLNANVGYALRRAQRAVAEARKGVSDVTQTRAALDQVSQWLTSAAVTSDRALQSLESARYSDDGAEGVGSIANKAHEYRHR